VIATMGQTVYTGVAALVTSKPGVPSVSLYLGGGSNPDGTGSCSTSADCIAPQACNNNVCGGSTSPFELRAYSDTDAVGQCTRLGAQKVYAVQLPPGQKLWAAPSLTPDTAFYATAAARSESVCASASGSLYQLSTRGDGVGGVYGGTSAPMALSGSPASSMRVYDGHALINTVGGQTTVVGGQTWNNAPTSGTGYGGVQPFKALQSVLWQEM
jgi:hypothetical protein